LTARPIAACLFAGALLVGPVEAAGFAGQAQTAELPLRLTLGCERASELVFRFILENVSTEPTAAVIGTILGNDKKYLPGPLGFTLRRAGEADVNFDWFDPSVVGISGRIDPWVIPLPAGASYSVTVVIPNGFRHLFFAPADVRLRMTTREIANPNGDLQGLRFIHVWIGTLTSDWIHVPESCRVR